MKMEEIKRYTDKELREKYIKEQREISKGMSIVSVIAPIVSLFILSVWIWMTLKIGFNIWLTGYLFSYVIVLLIVMYFNRKWKVEKDKLIKFNAEDKEEDEN